VGKMLAPKNLQTTQNYLKIIERQVSDDIAILNTKKNIT
jgi:hypothetical protein